MLRMAAEVDVKGDVRTMNQPRAPRAKPIVGQFDLFAITNLLREDPELIANPIAYGRNLECREGVEVTGCQPPQTAIAQSRIRLAFDQTHEVLAKTRHHVTGDLVKTQVDHSILQ